jgi:sugar phosphate isomerase/epimerase
MLPRRTFLGAFAGAALSPFAPRLLRAAAAGAADLVAVPLGVQLYTVRAAMRRDLVGTLEQVAAIGYREVEFAGYHDRPVRELRALLDRLGLTAPSAHVPLSQLSGDAWRRTLDDAAVLGHRWLTVPWLDARERRTLDDYRHVAATLGRAGREAQSVGMRVAYHNHDFELRPIDGPVPLELLLRETDPALVDFELDLYWLVRAGGDPLAWLARHPGRFAMLHLKDSAGPPDHRMVDVGAGTVDFAGILAARQAAGVRHLFVEHDDPADPLASIRASHAHLARLLP